MRPGQMDQIDDAYVEAILAVLAAVKELAKPDIGAASLAKLAEAAAWAQAPNQPHGQ